MVIIGIPIFIIATLIALLYIPPIQSLVVEKACEEISQKSGYDIKIGSIYLAFPLKLMTTDIKMSKNDTVYIQGQYFDANISLFPLFSGKVEANYLSLEKFDLNTRNMLPDISVEGEVGYARVVVRDADLANSVASIRQLHIADSDLNIALTDTTASEESEPLQWVINLRKGSIKNSSIGITLPSDTLSAWAYIEDMQLRRGRINIPETSFAIKEIALCNSRVRYDKGGATQQQAPLDHIWLEKINLNANELKFAGSNDISANITTFTLEQPEGLAVTNAAVHLTSSNDTLQLHRLEINSRNGSRIYGECTIPRQALINPNDKGFEATFSAHINKPDLAKLVTEQTYDNLHYFDKQLLNAELALSGSIQNINIDTVALRLPGVGALNANGNAQLKAQNTNAHIAFNAEVDDIKKFIENCNDSIDGRATAAGNIYYSEGVIDTDVALHCASGEIAATGSYCIADTTYNAQIDVQRLALSEILPALPLHQLKMNLKAKGNGIDLFSSNTRYEAELTLDTLHYAEYKLHTIDAKASQSNNVSLIEIDGNDKNLLFGIDATTVLKATGIENHTAIELTNADLKGVGVVDSVLKISTNIDIAAKSDFKESHSLKVGSNGINIITKQHRFTPENLSLDFATSPARTSINMLNGDLSIAGEMDCGYNKLFSAIEEIGSMHKNLLNGKNTLYNLNDYEKVLPCINLDFYCGEKNVLHNFLAFAGIEAKEIKIDADISQRKGLNIRGDIYKFGSGDIMLDSIKFATRQKKDRLYYIIGANNLSIASLDEENSHNALVYGDILSDTITTNFILRNNTKESDSKIGLITHLTPGNMNFHFAPEALLFGAPFSFSRNNYINIGKAMSIDADVAFTGGNDNGLRLYTTPDATVKYNVNLDIFNIHLTELANALPGVPNISGIFSAQMNYKQKENGDIFTCKAGVKELAYNDNPVGDEEIELVYSPKTNEIHDLSCSYSHNGGRVANVKSDYQRGRFDGNISLTRLPLSITQAFIDKEGVIIDGYLNSKIDFEGTLNDMKSYGYLHFDSTYAYSPMLGATLHPAEEMIMIENNKVNLQKYHIYDNANTPFVINGNVDITNLLNPKLSLRLNASNYEILNTPRDAGKMVYGKMYVDLRSMIRGTLDDIKMMGDLTILSNSNFAYVIPETAFDSNKELDGLVEFVNFNDTTATQLQEPEKIDLGDITANLNIIVQEGAKLSLDFDSSRENYVSIEGDANLNATYNSENGFNVTGIYKLNSGQVKLTLPIIPLKTFYIQEGSRLTWTGDLFDPILDVTALEKTTVSVEFDDNSIQPVVFNAGVVVSNSINNLAIDFTMSSPENSVIQSQLNELDRETLSRYAVAMIITGTYLGGRQGVTAASALSSFLDAKINEISGTAIKNFDVNIGINDGLNAETGNSYTNYSFSFSKRFFNDRITVVIGGEVNSGDRPNKSAGNETFINNISLEWKLNDGGNRYIRIFYDKNYQSLLEGEIIETGIGYVYKRKLNKLKELFIFKKKEKAKEKTALPDETNKTRAKQ